ncbi:MAG: hypothetical protein J6B52_00590 [Clostridia bacterium]|nr:hypothetical protein [Clostridia bacterium]
MAKQHRRDRPLCLSVCATGAKAQRAFAVLAPAVKRSRVDAGIDPYIHIQT